MLIGWVTPYLVHVSDSAYYAYVFSCLISTRSVFKRVSIQFRITREVDSKYLWSLNDWSNREGL